VSAKVEATCVDKLDLAQAESSNSFARDCSFPSAASKPPRLQKAELQKAEQKAELCCCNEKMSY